MNDINGEIISIVNRVWISHIKEISIFHAIFINLLSYSVFKIKVTEFTVICNHCKHMTNMFGIKFQSSIYVTTLNYHEFDLSETITKFHEGQNIDYKYWHSSPSNSMGIAGRLHDPQ